MVEAETGVQALQTDKNLKPLNVLETLTNHVDMQVLVMVLIYSAGNGADLQLGCSEVELEFRIRSGCETASKTNDHSSKSSLSSLGSMPNHADSSIIKSQSQMHSK